MHARPTIWPRCFALLGVSFIIAAATILVKAPLRMLFGLPGEAEEDGTGKVVLITGASRGLGAEFAAQYARSGWTVLAASRSGTLPAMLRLSDIGDVLPVKLDVLEPSQISDLAADLERRGLHVNLLINNAGIAPDRDATLSNVDYDAWELTLKTNVLGAHRVTAALMPALARSGPAFKVAFISSSLSSISDLLGEALPEDLTSTEVSYRSSKAALNMACACIAVELRSTHPRASVSVLNPGWVDTDMGSRHGTVTPPLKPPTVVAGMRRVISGLDARQSGAFLSWEGEREAW